MGASDPLQRFCMATVYDLGEVLGLDREKDVFLVQGKFNVCMPLLFPQEQRQWQQEAFDESMKGHGL